MVSTNIECSLIAAVCLVYRSVTSIVGCGCICKVLLSLLTGREFLAIPDPLIGCLEYVLLSTGVKIYTSK